MTRTEQHSNHSSKRPRQRRAIWMMTIDLRVSSQSDLPSVPTSMKSALRTTAAVGRSSLLIVGFRRSAYPGPAVMARPRSISWLGHGYLYTSTWLGSAVLDMVVESSIPARLQRLTCRQAKQSAVVALLRCTSMYLSKLYLSKLLHSADRLVERECFRNSKGFTP